MGNLCSSGSTKSEADTQGVVSGGGNNSGAISGGLSGPQTVIGESIQGGLSAGDAKAGGAGDVKKLDPKDFMCQKLENAVVIKPPGSINGQQFIIEDCKNCDIFVLDHCDSVNVDACTGCRVFVGPCNGSVFLRECVDCKWVVACQQLRTRDCKSNDILLYIGAGQPVIEASTDMRFGCFQASYFSLRAQFAAAKLGLWNSEWSDVFDFSRKADAGGDAKLNWSYLPADSASLGKLLRLDAPGIDKEGLTAGDTAADRVVPLTVGGAPRARAEAAFVAVFHSDTAFELLAKLDAAVAAGDLVLVRSRGTRLTKDNTALLFAADANAQKVANAPGAEVIGLEFAGADANTKLAAVLRDNGWTGGAAPKMFAAADAADSVRLIEAFFVGMKTKI